MNPVNIEPLAATTYNDLIMTTTPPSQACSLSQILHRDILCDVLISFDHLHDFIYPKVWHRQSFKDPRCWSQRRFDEQSNLSEAANNNVEKIVLPIFYGVNPSDVRHQRASFAIPFAKYEEKYKNKPEKVKSWRTALRELANVVGWDSKNWRETELIQDIVETIWTKLHPSPSKPAINNVPSMPKTDVFLSFRGKDTRLNFVDHLDAALIRRGISTFRDDKHLEKGITISEQLVKAIKGSKVSVVIVSPNYASSKWCLKELLKILESRKISPVGNKNGTLMSVFTQQEEKARNSESYKINKWKARFQNKETNSKHNKSLSSDTGFKKPLQNASERMESSENSGAAQIQRYGTYQGYFRGVTPNPVPFLNQQQPYNQQQHTTWQPYYEHYKPSYHQLKCDYRQPQSSYQQLSQVHHYHGYFHGVTPNPVPYLNQNQPYSQQQHTTWQPYYEHYKPSYHQLQWDNRQPQSSYQQLSQVHHCQPTMFWHHY